MKRLPAPIANSRAKLVLDNLLLSRYVTAPPANLKVTVLKQRKVQSPNSFFIAKWNFNEIK